MAGLLDNLATDPLFNVGMGLLSQGPSPYPIRPMQGVQQGLLNAQRAQAYQDRAAQEAQMMVLRQQQMMAENERIRMQREQMIAEQRAAEAEAARRKRVQELAAAGDYPGAALEGDPLAYAQSMAKPNEPDTWIASPDGQQQAFVTSAEAGRRAAAGWRRLEKAPSTIVNVGDKGLSVNDALKMVNNEGEHPAPGMSPNEAIASGFRLVDTESQKAGRKFETAGNVLDQLEALATPVFAGVKPGLPNRVAAGVELGGKRMSQEDTSVSEYASFAEGTVAPLIKALGESGNLATEDVNRGLALLPTLYPVPDTKEVAENKIANLRKLIEKGLNKKMEGISPPNVGDIIDGYRYEGGPPNNPASWKKQ